NPTCCPRPHRSQDEQAGPAFESLQDALHARPPCFTPPLGPLRFVSRLGVELFIPGRDLCFPIRHIRLDLVGQLFTRIEVAFPFLPLFRRHACLPLAAPQGVILLCQPPRALPLLLPALHHRFRDLDQGPIFTLPHPPRTAVIARRHAAIGGRERVKAAVPIDVTDAPVLPWRGDIPHGR